VRVTRHSPAEPAGRPRRSSAATWWRWYLLGGAVLLACVPFLSPFIRQGAFAVAGLSAVVAMAVGLRRHRPPADLPWRLLLTGLICTFCAVIYWALENSFLASRQFPSIGDLLYFAAYPLFLAGISTWVRRDRSRPGYEAIVDAGIVTCGLSVLTWTFIIEPILAQPSLEVRVPSVLAYTLLDLLIFAMAVRLVFRAGRRTTSYLLVLTGMMVLLTGDTLYYIGMAADLGRWTDAVAGFLWVAAYLLFGASALHPDMARSTGVVERSQPIASPVRLALYGFLAVLGPVVAVARVSFGGIDSDAADVVVPLAIAGVTAVLLVVRLGLLARLAHRRAAALDGALAEQQVLRDELTQRNLHDALTGLGNRTLLGERLHAVTGRHALLLLDLDGFKDVNDVHGHPVGDALLVLVAERLRAVVDHGATLVRLGGDEFALLLDGPAADGADGVAAGVVEEMRHPFPVGDGHTEISVSVGTLHAEEPLTPGEALRRADLALYAAKAAGRNRVEVYTRALADARDRRATMIADMRQGLADEEFAVHYQPVVDVTTGTVSAVEALLRWPRPGGTAMSPAEFVPIAEDSGLIVGLGAWVLRRALRDTVRWHRKFGIAVTVNVSARQLREPRFADLVLAELTACALPGRALVVEITETVLVAEAGPEAATVRRQLDLLRRHGVRVAVDDFGTGYSSLSYLRRLPVDVLKIDSSFVRECAESPDAAAFLRAIVDLARSLNLPAVAEAVETEAQARVLRRVHCALAQGYHFSRPVPADALDTLLERSGGHLGVAVTGITAA
jgi:diguanylate cyclase (GGDEF)-like protein